MNQSSNVVELGLLEDPLFRHVLVQHQLPVPQVVQNGAKVLRVAVNQVGALIVLWSVWGGGGGSVRVVVTVKHGAQYQVCVTRIDVLESDGLPSLLGYKLQKKMLYSWSVLGSAGALIAR